MSHPFLPDIPPIPGVDVRSSPTHVQPDDSLTEVRLLTQEEIYSLIPDFIDRGVELPDPATSFFVGAVDGEGKISFLVVQLRIHAEPMLIRPGHEHLFRRIVRTAEETIKERLVGSHVVFLFAPDGNQRGLAAAVGMTEEPWTVYSKTIECKPVAPAQQKSTETESEVIQ